jgi:hypothetical protein
VSASVSDAVALVALKGELVVPLEALQLAWSLEDRGGRLELDGDDLVLHTAPGLLTDADLEALSGAGVRISSRSSPISPLARQESSDAPCRGPNIVGAGQSWRKP